MIGARAAFASKIAAIGFVAFGTGEPQLEAEESGGFDPRVRHVVAVADPGDDATVERAEFFLHREQVGEQLTGMQQVGEPVDDRHGGVARQFLDVVPARRCGS